MFCQQCGTQIDDGLAFCTTCGAKQIKNAPPINNAAENMQSQPVFNNNFTQQNTQSAPNGYAQQQGYPQPNAYEYNPNVTATQKKVSFGDAIKLFFVNYVNFEGRATKEEYWFAFLFTFLVSLCTAWIPFVGGIISLALVIPGLSVAVRRLHDTGKSWQYLLYSFIPLAGAVILIIQYCKESDGDNKWGPAIRT